MNAQNSAKDYNMQGKQKNIYDAEKWIMTEEEPQKVRSAVSSVADILARTNYAEGVVVEDAIGNEENNDEKNKKNWGERI